MGDRNLRPLLPISLIASIVTPYRYVPIKDKGSVKIMPSKSVVLVVASFLVVVLIYGPTVTFAKPKLGPITCHTGQGLPSGKTECCQPTLSSVTGRVLLVYCTTCDDTTPPSNCSSRYLTSIGNVLPPSGNNSIR